MQVTIPPEAFNAAVKDGSVSEKMNRIMSSVKPESAYFTSMNGKRGGVMIVNMNETSEIPSLAEPWFLLFNADVQFSPCMTPEDLAKSGLDQMGKTWG